MGFAIPSGHRTASEFRMKNPSVLWRSLLFGRTGRLKHRLAAVGGQKKPPLSWRVFYS